jgi:hypothetical protein
MSTPQHSWNNQAYMQSEPQQKIMQMRWDIAYNPHKYRSNTPGGVQTSASQPPDPHWKASLILFSRWDVVCYCIHWVVQNTKQHHILFYAGSSVYTICFLISLFCMAWESPSYSAGMGVPIFKPCGVNNTVCFPRSITQTKECLHP